MLSLSPLKLLIVVVVAMVVLGPDKIPQFSRQAAHAWRAVRAFRTRIESEIRETIPDLPSSTEIVRMARSPVHYLNRLADMPTQAVESTKADLRRLGPPHGHPAAPSGDPALWEPGTALPNADAPARPPSPATTGSTPIGNGPADPGMN